MSRQRELELLFLTAVSAVPLYFTYTVGIPPLILFHAVLGLMMFRVWRGNTPAVLPEALLKVIAIAYVPFYFIDAVMISHSAIAASTHLVLFIAIYQPVESVRKDNHAQRLLTAAMIFVASVATSTHITIVLFVIAFSYLIFRQLMDMSHRDMEASLGRTYLMLPASRAAGFYLCGTVVIGALLFPLLPRVRNPLLPGMAGSLNNAATGLSDSIDFNRERTSTPDPAVVARVWMGAESIPFFTPLRLRATVYDRYDLNQWRQSRGDLRELRPTRNGYFRIAKPLGFTRGAVVQERLLKNARFFFPVGTYSIRGIQRLFVGYTREAYWTPTPSARDMATVEVSLARDVEPLREETPTLPAYPITPAVTAMARQIVKERSDVAGQAASIERYLATHFQYLARPEQIGRVMSVDDFLLRDHRGHCEYFAAGMVALLTSLGVPSRIVGGFYGGELNPLTGYFIVRREDAHAWVEVWAGSRWQTYDPTPEGLRPGTAQSNVLKMYATAISDSINYFWDRYILTYGLGDQIALMVEVITRTRDMLSGVRGAVARLIRSVVTPWGLAVLLTILALALVPFIVARRRRSLFDLLSAYLPVGSSTTMEEALAELRTQNPDLARELEPLVALYEAERFSPKRDRQRVKFVRRRLAEIRT
ncbi:MAG: transglutaminase TgpA family protein [Thermoanaerobaculia bacterium]